MDDVNQRWNAGRASYRPAGEPIDTRRYEVAAIAEDTPAKAFVEAHHYDHSYPAAVRRFGLYRGGDLVGAAVFSEPVNSKMLDCLPCPRDVAADLGRFVLLDDVPGNGETWFLGRCFDLLRREGFEGIVSTSDPVARRAADGTTVFRGHIGTIYQAFNGVYVGRTTARTMRLLPDGRVLNDRTIQKARNPDEKGHEYAVRLLEAAGAAPLRGDPGAWTRRWVNRLTRPLRHPGKHKYAWVLNRRLRRRLGRGQDYPKFTGR